MHGRTSARTLSKVSLILIIGIPIPLTAFNPPAIEHATAAGLKEIGAALSKIVAMGAEKGTRYYNTNRERIGKSFRSTSIPDAH